MYKGRKPGQIYRPTKKQIRAAIAAQAPLDGIGGTEDRRSTDRRHDKNLWACIHGSGYIRNHGRRKTDDKN